MMLIVKYHTSFLIMLLKRMKLLSWLLTSNHLMEKEHLIQKLIV